jgi:hypothetical protein
MGKYIFNKMRPIVCQSKGLRWPNRPLNNFLETSGFSLIELATNILELTSLCYCFPFSRKEVGSK